jgi:hypothetical protein
VLNRIRRAVTLTRARYFPRGRHRRPLRRFQPPIVPASWASVDEPTLVLGRAVDKPSHHHPLRGEDTALVRPYVLVHEERAARWPSMVVIAPYLPTDAWLAPLGAH